MRVIYSVNFEIEVEATTRDMAIHQAGEQWPELREAIEGLGSGVTIKRIQVVGEKADSDKEGAE